MNLIKKIPLKKVFEEFAEIRLVASSLAYSSLLSIIPFLIIVLAGFQYIGGLEEFYPKIEALLFSYLKEATGATASKYIRGTLEQVDFRTLGISGGILLAWASIGLLRNIDYAINRLWKINITTALYKRLWLYTAILVAVPIGLALFIGMRSLFFINVGIKSFEHQFLLSIWIWFFIFVLYKVIPRVKVNFVPALISSALTSLGLLVVQKSFLWISLKVFKQNKIYGSLASFPIFLIWLLVIWYVVLLGVVLCAFLQQNTFKRS